jgi:hypothetical protein
VRSVPEPHDKWDRLKELLRHEPEFEARYPEAYDLLFEHEAACGVYLPSFGVRVLDNAHQTVAIRRPQLRGVDHEGGFADAYSFQSDGVWGPARIDPRWPHSLRVPAPPGRAEDEIEVTGRFPPMYGGAWISPPDATDMQGLLLAIMSRDELSGRGEEMMSLTDRAVYEYPPVRITDLRLSIDLFEAVGKRGDLQKMLRPLIETLPKPITQESAIRWKRETLKNLTGEPDPWLGSSSWDDVWAVTFVTAAICLLLDLGGPELDSERPLILTNTIVGLADEIRKVTHRLNTSAADLAKIVADRSEGRPKRSDFECLFALSCYRLGWDLRLIAERNNINPFDAKGAQGTKNWRKKVMDIVIRGVNTERRLYPRASDIFEKENDPEVIAKAEKAYRAFVWAMPPNALIKAGEAVRLSTASERGSEVVPAYVQLGACKYHDIEPRPGLNE